MISKEEFDRIDEEYAKRSLKAADEAFGAPKIYVRADIVKRNNPLPIRHKTGTINTICLDSMFRLSKKQTKELMESARKTEPTMESQIFANHILPSTLTPRPEDNWLYGNFIKDMIKEKQRDKIIFKFGEFVGQLSKEEKVSYSDIVNVLLEFIEQNIKK